MSPHSLFPPRCAVTTCNSRTVPITVPGLGRVCVECAVYLGDAARALNETPGISGMAHPNVYRRNNLKNA